ncbi:MAG: DnaA regulatory inactivator Hda [Porticoccus sp.]
MPRQLSLSINLNDDATFENFFLLDQDHKSQVIALLRRQLMSGEESFVYLWGPQDSGISHLLQASCHRAAANGLQVQYLPLAELLDYPPHQLLENLEHMPLICLDDIQLVAGRPVWEEALFSLYNRVRQANGRLLVGADCAPRELPLQLPDLQSRLGWGPVFQLQASDDDVKTLILQFRASRRGMELGDDVARFLINRTARDLSGLMACLDTLEGASLEARRKLSIPFVKQVFDW